MSTAPRLTTTTYGVLGLLAVRPHSTYELAKAMDRSVGRVWPRAQSKLFEEPKKLVAHGYATAREESVGRRPRTVYTITRSGRRALAAWLAEPGDGPALEFEGLVKLIFADHGTRDDALASIARAREWAVEMNTSSIEAGEKFVEKGGLYEQRRATTLCSAPSSPTSTRSSHSGPTGRPRKCRGGRRTSPGTGSTSTAPVRCSPAPAGRNDRWATSADTLSR